VAFNYRLLGGVGRLQLHLHLAAYPGPEVLELRKLTSWVRPGFDALPPSPAQTAVSSPSTADSRDWNNNGRNEAGLQAPGAAPGARS
jgi:hypothetical protein